MTLLINTPETVLSINKYSQLSMYHTLTFFVIPKEGLLISLNKLLELVKKDYLHSIEDREDCLRISVRTKYVKFQ